MANDVEVIDGTRARAAARLCNFVTGETLLQYAHMLWLDRVVAPILRSQPNSWVDLIGYASRVGDVKFNKHLSYERCQSTKNRVATYANKVNFNVEQSWGESKSGLDEQNNDGFWRSVDIYVYSFEPPSRKKKEQPPPEKPITTKRIIQRSFTKFSTTKISGKGDDPGKEIYEFFRDLLFKQIVPTEVLGFENARKYKFYPIDFRVNTVVLNETTDYQDVQTPGGFLQPEGIPMGNVTTTFTTIDYDWGPPRQDVTITTKNEVTVNGKVTASNVETKFVPRKEAEKMPLIVPPDE